MKHAAFISALALAACQPAAAPPAAPADAAPAAEAAPAPAAPTTPSGPAQTVEAEDDHFPEAYVTDVHNIPDADFKIFSTAGGDPAVNGLYTYLAHYDADERGWTQVYMIGDFNAWEVVEESPTRAVLKVSRSWLEQATGEIKTTDEKLILDFPATPDAGLTVTPAT